MSVCSEYVLQDSFRTVILWQIMYVYAGALMYVAILRMNIEGATVDDQEFISLILILLSMT
jgi:hypothetical protein